MSAPDGGEREFSRLRLVILGVRLAADSMNYRIRLCWYLSSLQVSRLILFMQFRFHSYVLHIQGTIIFSMEKEMKIIDWEQDFLYTKQ